MREFAALVERHNTALERADYHAALVCAVIANVNRDPKRTPKAYSAIDFMPTKQHTTPKREEREDLDDLLAFAGSMGAEVKVHRDN